MKTKDVYMYIYFSSSNVFENGCIFNNYSTRARWISNVIIQQIVTMPTYGKEPSISVILHDRYPAIYVNDHIWKCTAHFLSLFVWRPF